MMQLPEDYLKSPLFITFFFCLLAKHVHSLTDCKFDGYCQPYGSDWWKYHSEVCFQCPSGKKYHCARDYDSKEFKEDCAEEKFCPQGEEPYLSYLKDGKPITEPIVYCLPCFDKERFNDQPNTSSAVYSECPYTKENKCTKEKHKKLCKPDDMTDERYCRCDARNGFYPVNDFSYQKCSYKDYDCGDYKKCADKEELLLNYTCAAKCPDGFGRLDEDTDDCKPLPSVEKKTITISTLETTNSNRTTVPSSPESTAKPTQGCVEECHEYKICVDGKCVCLDNCTSVREPVCGHHAGLKSEYKTFPSICELRRSRCTDKKYIFYSSGECSKEDPKSPVLMIILIVLGCIILLCLALFIICKTKFGRPCRNRLSRCYETNSNSSGPQLTNVDGSQANGNPPNEVLSDRSRPKGSQKKGRSVIIQNVHKYYAPVVQTEGSETHISMTSGSDSITMTYNKDQIGDGEGDPLLTGDGDTVPVQEQRGRNTDSREQLTQPINASRNTQLESDPFLNSNASAEGLSEMKNRDTDNNVEADSDENKPKQVQITEKNHQKLGRAYKRQRQNSMSYESLFLEPNIKDITEVTHGSDECKDAIDKVMHRSYNYLVDNMDPKAIIDVFYAKEILTYSKRRDISNLGNQSDQSRAIIKSIMETGARNYQALKSCLADSKQFECLEKLEQIQDEVVKDLQKKQSLEQQSSQQKKETLEEEPCKILKDFSMVLKIYDGKEPDDTEKAFKAFIKLCKDVREQNPDLELEKVVTDKPPDSLPEQEEYRNTPKGFQAYRSSGKDNSCLYQAVSLLLTGTEDLQYFLRLLGTLHAVEKYSTYKEQLQLLDADKRKLFFYTNFGQIQNMDDSEDVSDKFLKTLIMETACVGTDSSALHVAFLSGALGMNIHQYFQHCEDNGAKIVEILKEINIPGCFIKPGLPELNIFWVNMKNEENGIMNHFVPLLPKKETTEEK